MRELARVLAPGGWCLIMVPLDLTRTATSEDPAIRGPEARRRAYSRPDHVRMYAPDISGRLAGAWLTAQRMDPGPELGATACARASLGAHELIWLCRPEDTAGTVSSG